MVPKFGCCDVGVGVVAIIVETWSANAGERRRVEVFDIKCVWE